MTSQYTVTGVMLALLASVSVLGATAKYYSLMPWIGQYQSKTINTRGEDFFSSDSLVAADLSRHVPPEVLRMTTIELTSEIPIESIDNYIVVARCKPHACPSKNAIFLFGTLDDELVAIYYDGEDGKNDQESTTCYGSVRNLGVLPQGLKERILQMHIPRLDSADRLFPKNAWLDGVQCKN